MDVLREARKEASIYMWASMIYKVCCERRENMLWMENEMISSGSMLVEDDFKRDTLNVSTVSVLSHSLCLEVHRSKFSGRE